MNIIFQLTFGSHLYGTDTPASDKDFKGVFIASLEDIVLGKAKETIVLNEKISTTTRNQAGDTDTEWKELRRFIKDAMDGQTYALDMLFAPDDRWIDHTNIWKDLIKNRNKLLSRNVQPYLGYIRQQTSKYGLKGSRLSELCRAIEYFKQFPAKTKVADALLQVPLTYSEYITDEKRYHTKRDASEGQYESFIGVLGKCIPHSGFTGPALHQLEVLYSKAGERAKQAQNNNGVDWKAVSHAYRCCYQLIELANTGHITFPLAQADILKDIKQGKKPFSIVDDELPILMQEAFTAVENSVLPEQPDRDFWEQWIIDRYVQH